LKFASPLLVFEKFFYEVNYGTAKNHALTGNHFMREGAMETNQTQNAPSSDSCNPTSKASCGIASNIQRLMYVLLSFALLCILFLIQGGEAALVPGSKTKFPIANVEVDFIIFLFWGPVLLLLLMVYLHMFLGAWDQCSRALGHEKLICIFSCSSATARLAFVGIFFVMTPLILCMFLYSARSINEITPVTGLMVIIGLIYLTYQMVRLNLGLSWWIKGPVVGLFLGALGVVSAIIWGPVRLYEIYPLQLSGSNLADTNFNLQDCLRGAKADRINFEDSLFYRSDLTGIYAPMGNFKKAKMTEATLTGADLGSADFTNAILQYSKLIDAKLANTNFTRAAMRGVDLTSTKIGTDEDKTTTDSAIFYQTDLREGTLKRSFKWCLFVETNLKDADFSGALLPSAIFINVDLKDAKNLTQGQLQYACADRPTITKNPSLTIPPCPDDLLAEIERKILAITQSPHNSRK
jgi:uncharacterized protein YjbI with pentapeptide repeats